jgi:hypothetical protein
MRRWLIASLWEEAVVYSVRIGGLRTPVFTSSILQIGGLGKSSPFF